MWILFIIVIIALIIVVSNIAVVQQSRAYVIERLGAFQTVWGVGLHFKVPFIAHGGYGNPDCHHSA